MGDNPFVNVLNRLDTMFSSVGISPDATHEEALATLVVMYRHAKKERDEAFREAAAAREESRRMGELLVEYHDALLGMVDETDPEVLAVMVAALRTLGRENEAKACEVLARWPEVKP